MAENDKQAKQDKLDRGMIKALVNSGRSDYKEVLAGMLGVPEDQRKKFIFALEAAEDRGYADAINDVANRLASWERPRR